MYLSGLDMAALLVSLVIWVGYTIISKLPGIYPPSLANATSTLRIKWMRRMCDAEVRVGDASLIGYIMRSVAFFASASILVLSGLVALIGSGEKAYDVFQSLPFHDRAGTLEQFETKAVLLICVFIYAFFQITWSMRQFNYCCILMGAAPTAKEDDALKDSFAFRAAQMGSLASDSFHMGLRAYYFALAMLAWFISSWLFMATSLLVMLITYRREFRSHTIACLRAAIDNGP
jgi:uncharacterized membrane protein